MRLLVDENVHRVVVARLREAGHEVEWIKQTSPGALDPEILGRPDLGSMIFVTHDRGFGDLIFSKGLPTPYAILYTRLPHRLPNLTADLLIALLERGVSAGQMVTIKRDGSRTKPFPSGASDG